MSIRDRKDVKEQLLRRAQESYDTKDQSGKFGTIFKSGMSRPFWKCVEGEHVIDILLWEAGDNYPNKNYKVAKGDLAHVLDIWIHRGIGANEDSFICPSRNYEKDGRPLPCPICEHINQLKKDPEADKDPLKKYIKDISPTRRAIYLIVCYDNDTEERKGVQIWDVAHFFMEKHLAEISHKPRVGGFVPYTHWDEGSQVYFKRKGTGQQSTEFLAHQFLERDYTIAEGILEQMPSLDQCIINASYETLYEAFHGGLAAQRSEPQQEAEGQDPAAPSTERKPKAVSPGRTARRSRQSPEEATPKTERKETPAEEASGDGCPGGGTYGVDVDRLDHCGECVKWDACAKAADEIETGKTQSTGGETARVPRATRG